MTMTKQDILRCLEFAGGPRPMLEACIRLFAHGDQAEIPNEPNQYAVHAQLLLEGGQGCAGALTLATAPDAGRASGYGVCLRMVQPGAVRDPNLAHAPPKPILANYYFELSRVVALVQVVEVKQAPRIIG